MKLFGLAQYRLRILFRGAFLFLAAATVFLALTVLQEEKQLSTNNYRSSFVKTHEQIAARLRHPSGQLALLNPNVNGSNVTPLRPLLLPFAGIDFDDQHKVRHAVEMAGCMVQYQDGSSLCAAIGSNPWAGGFIYLAGHFESTALVPHLRGDMDLSQAHRVRVSVTLRGQEYRWIAPFETLGEVQTSRLDGIPGRLTGFIDDGRALYNVRPVKDFRGWIWQSGQCVRGETEDCPRRSFFSLRLPVALLRDALFQFDRPQWPPADLDQIRVHLQVLPPGEGEPLFDSNSDGAMPPFALNDLAPLLLPGETLQVRKLAAKADQYVAHLVGTADAADDSWPLMDRLIRLLPVEQYETVLDAREVISTPAGSYEVLLKGDVRSVNKRISQVATRVVWFVGAMLGTILLAWLVIEIGMVRRITLLTRRAGSVSKTVKGAGGGEPLDLTDLRGADELGVLANCLHDLLQRVREDAERERIRAEQEKDMWHAVGHEIMSPLQSLLALHGASNDPSARYIHRMQQAIRVLYGSASPSEAFQTTHLQLQAVEIDAFLRHVAENAPCVGIAGVEFVAGDDGGVLARADEYSLEDVVTHVLRNADRHRTPGSVIRIELKASENAVTITIHNQGPQIPADWMDKIFEYGVSDQQEAGANGNRGQGLFVAKTYMAKMGGTIVAQNIGDGVSFVLTLQRAGA